MFRKFRVLSAQEKVKKINNSDEVFKTQNAYSCYGIIPQTKKSLRAEHGWNSSGLLSEINTTKAIFRKH